MKTEQLVEAALFLSTDPVSVEELCMIAGEGSDRIRRVIQTLEKLYKERESAIEIRKIGDDHYIMQAKDIFAVPLIDLVKPTVSQEVLKTLSLIALKQPVTQAEIVRARGYCTYRHVKELVNKDFILAEPSGRTKMLTTTQRFADYFGFPQDIVELKKELARQLKK